LPIPDRRLTRVCAEVIRHWHEGHGPDHPSPDLSGEQVARGRALLQHFRKADLADERVQEEIAREQLSGAFEWSSRASVPPELWDKVVQYFELPMHPGPRNLHEAAIWILEPPKQAETHREVEDDRRTVRARNPEELLIAAQEYYADIAQATNEELGGVNVLLSSSLERRRRGGRYEEPDQVTLLSAATLGFRFVEMGEREDDFIDALREGVLHVQTTGEPG
jgi:hypothetical protein